jgi:hypothetical protein
MNNKKEVIGLDILPKCEFITIQVNFINVSTKKEHTLDEIKQLHGVKCGPPLYKLSGEYLPVNIRGTMYQPKRVE